MTDRHCPNLDPHHAHDWTGMVGTPGYHCPGIHDDDVDHDDHISHDPFSTVEGLSRYVDQLRDAIDQHAARRVRDNERHTRQMTELGQQLNEFRHIIEANKVGDLARRVTMLETTAGKYNTLDEDVERFDGDDTMATTGVAMLEAYRQGQRDAYRAAAAMARNTPTDDFSATLNHLAGDPA